MFLCLSHKTTLKFLVSNNDFLKCTDFTPVVTDRIQTRTESQIQMILHIFITVHTHWVKYMYYNLTEDNENVEKHQKPVLLTTAWEYYIYH